MSVLVMLEQRGDLKNCALEAATIANGIAQKAGMDLNAVYIGQSLEDQADQLNGLGIRSVYAYENDITLGQGLQAHLLQLAAHCRIGSRSEHVKLPQAWVALLEVPQTWQIGRHRRESWLPLHQVF